MSDTPTPDDAPTGEDATRDDASRPADDGPASRPTDGEAGRSSQPGPKAADLQDEIEERYHELEERYDEFRGQLEHYNESAQNFIRNHPVACLAGALGAGYIVGRLASRRWLK